MTSSQQLARRLQEVLLDGKWIANTNYRQEIEHLSWQEATRQVDQFNSVAKLTFHINYYLAGLLQVLNGGPLTISDRFSFDLPTISHQAAWDQLVEDFIKNATIIVEKIAQLDDAEMEAPFVDERYGNYRRNLEALIEHGYYHLGQLVLIKKIKA
ncbi:MAG: DinB family protein [Salibacteraceae bacterium]